MDKFFIGPLSSGKEKNVKPFMLPDDAFERLNNAYVFRGSIRKRFGERLMVPTNGAVEGYEYLVSRLRISVGSTDGVGDLTVGAGADLANAEVGSMFSCGTDLFTVFETGSPMTLVTNGTATTHTFDTTSGALVIAGSQHTLPVYYYPAEPVMGLMNYEFSKINDEPLYAFDTKFAYYYEDSGWLRLGTKQFTGSDHDFFWGENHRGADAALDSLFITNNVEADGMTWYSAASPAGSSFKPIIDAAGSTIETCKCIISFHNRLILCGTTEKVGGTSVTYKSRIRISWEGSPFDVNAFREDIPGRGSGKDMPTQEAIVTVQHLKDRVIFYCERSTWELVFRMNAFAPFEFQQINTELGAESTFSQISFDGAVLGVGNVGIHACDGQGVKRIDEKIPDEVFNIHNKDAGLERVAGIRDFVSEQVFWTFPSKDRTTLTKFPDQVLVFNYNLGTWATFDDTITAWGYCQEGNKQVTWADLTVTSWADWLVPWEVQDGGLASQPKNRNVIAGNQQGFVFIVDADKPTNCPSTYISSIAAATLNSVPLVVRNHNLKVGDYVLVETCKGITAFNDQILRVDAIGPSANELTLYYPGAFTGTYTGGGTLTKVSRIDILTKQYNFYSDEGCNMSVNRVDFNVDKTENGEITVDYSTSTTGIMMSDDAIDTGCDLGEPILETSAYELVPMEEFQKQLWHAYYLQARGSYIQFRFFMTDEQMLLKSLSEADFQLNAFIISTERAGRLQ